MGKCGRVLLIAIVASAFLGACSRHPSTPNRQPTVRVGIFSTYSYPELALEFEKKTGIRPEFLLYTSNEQMLGNLESGAVHYDIVIASDYLVASMVRKGLLQPLPPEAKKFLPRFDPRFLGHSFDPHNDYSLPIGWGTTGIATNTDLIKNPVRSWKELLEDPSLKGKFSILDDMRESIGAALKLRGKSLNDPSIPDLRVAEAILGRAIRRSKILKSNIVDAIVDKQIAVAHIFSNNAVTAYLKSDGKVVYSLPKEGATLWLDTLVIPKNSENLASAERWMEYFLDPAIALRFAAKTYAGPTQKNALPELPVEIREHPAYSLSPGILNRLEEIKDLGEVTPYWDKTWARLRNPTR